MEEPSPNPKQEKASPRLHGKIGNVDAEQIEKAIEKIKQDVLALQEERKQKESLLKSLISSHGTIATSSRTIATRTRML